MWPKISQWFAGYRICKTLLDGKQQTTTERAGELVMCFQHCVAYDACKVTQMVGEIPG